MKKDNEDYSDSAWVFEGYSHAKIVTYKMDLAVDAKIMLPTHFLRILIVVM